MLRYKKYVIPLNYWNPKLPSSELNIKHEHNAKLHTYVMNHYKVKVFDRNMLTSEGGMLSRWVIIHLLCCCCCLGIIIWVLSAITHATKGFLCTQHYQFKQFHSVETNYILRKPHLPHCQHCSLPVVWIVFLVYFFVANKHANTKLYSLSRLARTGVLVLKPILRQWLWTLHEMLISDSADSTEHIVTRYCWTNYEVTTSKAS